MLVPGMVTRLTADIESEDMHKDLSSTLTSEVFMHLSL